MFKSYLTTALRNFTRNRLFSFINIVGLGVGMACSILIFMWVFDEQNINSSLANNKTFGVYESVYSDGQVTGGHQTPGLLAAELKSKIPEIKYASGFWSAQEILFTAGDKNINEKGCYADSDFFKMFNYHLLEGTAASALADPDAIALSKTMAVNFFGSPKAAIGKTVLFNKTINFKVLAVFDDLPASVSEKFDYALNWQYLLKSVGFLKDWNSRAPATFIQLEANADPTKVQVKIKDFLKPYLISYGKGYHLELGLQRFDQMYLNGTFTNGVPDGGRVQYVRIFSIIAVLVLLIACINFMNLATARSARRAKEVGVRKTIGALKSALITQFIGETMFLAFLAFLLAIVLVVVLLPAFNQLTGKSIVMPFYAPWFWLSSLSLLLVTGIISGSYPAFFLSSLQPVKVLNGAFKFSFRSLLFRQGLVVFQFSLSIIFIIAATIMAQQVSFIQNKNLGFNKENLVYVPVDRDLGGKFHLFKQELSSLPGIVSVTYSNQLPTQIGATTDDITWDGKSTTTKISGFHNGVSYDYLKTMNLKLLTGRDFSRDFDADNSGYLINETALKLIGYKDPIGKSMTMNQKRGKIIGVLKDFNFQSLHDPVKPLIIDFTGEQISWDGGFAIIKTQTGKTKEAVSGLQNVFNAMEPKIPFKYSFADQEYQKLYQNEQVVSQICACFSILAIFISCLGLLGLALFMSEQRTKEISIRKIIGAKVSDIIVMLSKDILKLVFVSILIATPLAWLEMTDWLQNFAFRVPISWLTFAAVGGLTILIALLTISFQAIKAAFANPVDSFKSS